MDVLTDAMRYIILVLSIVGLIGNIYALVVFTGKEVRQKASSPYLICIAISDIIAIGAETSIIANLFEVHIPVNQLSCGITLYFTYSAFFFCSWSIVLATLERTVAVTWPLRYYKHHSSHKSWSLIIGLMILTFSYHLWIVAIVDEGIEWKLEGNKTIASTVCDMRNTTAAHAAYLILNTIDVGASFSIPVMAAGIMNCIMLRQLYQASMRRRALLTRSIPTYERSDTHGDVSAKLSNGRSRNSTTPKENQCGLSKDRRVTICLLLISVVFIALNLPLYLFQTLVEHGHLTSNSTINNLFFLLYISQFAVNYLLYSVGFSCYLFPPCLRSSPTQNMAVQL